VIEGSDFCIHCGQAVVKVNEATVQPRTEEKKIPQPTPSSTASNRTTVTPKQKPVEQKSEKTKFTLMDFAIIAVVVIVIIFLVRSCDSTSKLKGTWEMEEDGETVSFTFTDDKNGYITYDGRMASEQVLDFTYFISDDELVIKTKATLQNDSKTERFEFKITGETLKLTNEDGETIKLKKK